MVKNSILFQKRGFLMTWNYIFVEEIFSKLLMLSKIMSVILWMYHPIHNKYKNYIIKLFDASMNDNILISDGRWYLKYRWQF